MLNDFLYTAYCWLYTNNLNLLFSARGLQPSWNNTSTQNTGTRQTNIVEKNLHHSEESGFFLTETRVVHNDGF